MARMKQQDSGYDDERIPLGTFSQSVPHAATDAHAVAANLPAAAVPESEPELVELEVAPDEDSPNETSPDEASFHDVIPDNFAKSEHVAESDHITGIDYEVPSAEYATIELLGSQRSPRGRVATLVGVPAAPAELLEMARAQRGSYPSPPSYTQVKQTLETLSGASSPAPIRPSKVPTVAPPKNTGAAAPTPVSALDLDSPFEMGTTSETENLRSKSMAAPDVSGLLQEFAEQISDGRINQTAAHKSNEPPLEELSNRHLTEDDEVTPIRSLSVTALDSGAQKIATAHNAKLEAVPAVTLPPKATRPSPTELTPFAVDSLAPRELTRARRLRPASARTRGPVLAAVAAVFLVGGFAASYTGFAPAADVPAADVTATATNGSTAGIQPGLGVSPVQSASRVVADIPTILEKPATRVAVAPALIPATLRTAKPSITAKRAQAVSSAKSNFANAAQNAPAVAGRKPPHHSRTTAAAPHTLRPVAAAVDRPVLRIRPVGASTAWEQPASSRVSSSPGPALPKRQDVQNAMKGVRDQVRACADGKTGTAQVTATAVASGRLNHVLVRGDFSGTPEGSCIARVVRGARLPPFAKRQFEFSYPFSM